MADAFPPGSSDDLVRLSAELAARPYAKRGVAMRDESVRVVLADDHTMVREGLRLLLRSAPDITVVGEADSGATAIEVSQRVRPDILVLDLDMPGGDGLTALRALKEAVPEVRVLILSVHAERERLVPLLEAGARGYLTKEAASQDLIDAIRVVAGGEVYVRPATARLLAAAIVPQHAARTARDRFETLSEREQTTLRLVAKGHTGAEIARQLGISTKTVDAYKHRVQEKLGLVHRTDYVRFAVEAGLLESDSPSGGKTALSTSPLPDTATRRRGQP